MAGDWIKMRVKLPEEPEVIELAEMLGMDEDHVVGKLHRLWSWFDQATTDGNAVGVTKKWLDRYLRTKCFADALEKVGWLEVKNVGDKVISVMPKFDRHNGQSGKQRALTARRVARSRGGKTCNAKRNASVTKETLPPLLFSSLLSSSSEKVRTTNRSAIEVPAELDTPEFAEAWRAWEQHRREIKKPLTATSIERQLKKFAEWGPARAIAAIEYTIEKGWQGLREPEQSRQADPRGNMAALQRYLEANSDE